MRALAAWLVLVAGCAHDLDELHDYPCPENHECPEGLACRDDLCQAPLLYETCFADFGSEPTDLIDESCSPLGDNVHCRLLDPLTGWGMCSPTCSAADPTCPGGAYCAIKLGYCAMPCESDCPLDGQECVPVLGSTKACVPKGVYVAPAIDAPCNDDAGCAGSSPPTICWKTSSADEGRCAIACNPPVNGVNQDMDCAQDPQHPSRICTALPGVTPVFACRDQCFATDPASCPVAGSRCDQTREDRRACIPPAPSKIMAGIGRKCANGSECVAAAACTTGGLENGESRCTLPCSNGLCNPGYVCNAGNRCWPDLSVHGTEADGGCSTSGGGPAPMLLIGLLVLGLSAPRRRRNAA